MRNRPGFTLPDVLVSLVVMGVIGASLAQVMTVQSRFYQTQEGRSQARAVSRAATSIMLAELRMVETGSGVVAATPTSITLRVPVEMGIVCENGASVYAAMAPVDSAVLHSGGSSNSSFSGYAWRTSAGSYTYVPGAMSVGWNNAQVKCTGVTPNPIDVVPGGRLVNFNGPIGGAVAGTPLFLYQEINYSLSSSATVPGRIGLWRTMVSQSLAEEIVAPFDNSAVFRFYTDASSAAQAAVPSPLSDIRGIELQLTGINERAGNTNLEERTPLTTSVFFKNRT